MLTRSTGLHALTLTALTAALVACGGGGGGGPTTTTTPVATPTSFSATCTDGTTTTSTVSVADATAKCPAPVAVPTPATVVTSVPAGTYAANSEELAAFNLLNAERKQCGFGLLAQSTALDAAARSHADYQLVNSLVSHFEDLLAFPNGFTGVFAKDRAIAKGYSDAKEVEDLLATYSGTTNRAGFGLRGTRSLLSGPYHMKGMLSGFRDIGISVRSSGDAGVAGTNFIVQKNLAYRTTEGEQLTTSGEILTYPCEGTAGVNRQLTTEDPNPVPGRNLSKQPLGTAVYIQTRTGDVLTITSAEMTQISTGLPVPLRVPVTSTNDPYSPCGSGCFMPHQAYVIADAPMQANSEYLTKIIGTANGKVFNRTFTFTTGTGG